MIQKSNQALSVCFYLLCLFFLVLFGFPFILILLMSFKSQTEYMTGNYWGFPQALFLGNYQKVLLSSFNIYFLNSAIVSLASVLITVIIASMAGYVFAKMRFKFSGAVLLFFVVG
ncbi:MAG: carbohydrate ABC transporter permease, partial [Treponema sp.]|nr:carbohydrate ABC transporter permease [Treponema sp.]